MDKSKNKYLFKRQFIDAIIEVQPNYANIQMLQNINVNTYENIKRNNIFQSHKNRITIVCFKWSFKTCSSSLVTICSRLSIQYFAHTARNRDLYHPIHPHTLPFGQVVKQKERLFFKSEHLKAFVVQYC
jgi:hypothetical protein